MTTCCHTEDLVHFDTEDPKLASKGLSLENVIFVPYIVILLTLLGKGNH